MLSEERQNALARSIQEDFPLVSDPWTALARRLGIHPTAVRRQVTRWRDEGLLREVSAVLEGSALGYDSALCAGKVPERDLERVAAVLNEHPTITHNYRRDHDYNLWFTLAVPHEMGIEPTLERLAQASGVPQFLALRRTRTFKIGVNFDLQKRCSVTEKRKLARVAPVTADAETRRLFRALQTPLPLTERPFATLAEQQEVDEEALLALGRTHMGGAVRRYVGTFRHRALGVRGNGMAVWNVPEADHVRVGAIFASAPEVSHCYARNAIEGFPYSVYSMVHGPDQASVRGIVERMSREAGVDDVLILFSSREYKKCRLRYFLPELDAWWAHHSRGMAA
jgi:siroheme decarboxylase